MRCKFAGRSNVCGSRHGPTCAAARRWSATVPVHLWHGRQEWATHVSAIRAVADHRAGWDVLVVPGCSALLGFWPELFLQAQRSFATRNPDIDPSTGDGQELALT